jgi:hypothetical protein
LGCSADPHEAQASRPTWEGFCAWAAAGALFAFSLLTGFSVGLFLVPLVALGLYLAARVAPDYRAALVLVAGTGCVLIGVSSIHSFSVGWLIPGAVTAALSLASFIALSERGRHQPS